MRIIFIIIHLFFFSIHTNSQIITFQDLGLKSYLLNKNCVDTIGYANGIGHINVDLNNDHEIQYSEAQQVLHLNLGNYSDFDTTINSLKDLDFFTHLRSLHIGNLNKLSEISQMNLDSLKSLHVLGCAILKRVDISNLEGLTDELRIESTSFIDYLNIQNGSVTNLFSMFYSTDLKYACVDSIEKEYNVILHQAGTIPSINCITNNQEVNINMDVQIQPNPTYGIVHISSEDQVNKLTVINTIGEVVLDTHKPTHSIDLSPFKSGLYFIILFVGDEMEVKKIIKR